MGRYVIDMSSEGIMGEGTSSICRKAVNTATGETVAIKVYKAGPSTSQAKETIASKFQRQIEVLKLLKLQRPSDEKLLDPLLRSPQVENTPPSKLFMQLLDYSKDGKGQPGEDRSDGRMYVVTELADYSLKDFLLSRRSEKRPLSKETVCHIARSIVLVMAGLHARGLVHLDLKPENLMVFDGDLKLIDVDGCVRVGAKIQITDSTISFSPCYCAPEWASFLTLGGLHTMVAAPGLDVWSVGITICELATLEALLKPMYANFSRHAKTQRKAGFMFLEWLGSLKEPPLDKRVHKFDGELARMLREQLLICDKSKRRTMAQCLDDPYFACGRYRRSQTSPLNLEDEFPPSTPRQLRRRLEDHSSKVVHQGTLWKLKMDQDPKDRTQWEVRDTWVSQNGALCYFSLRANKRLVLLDPHKMHMAEVSVLSGAAMDHALQITAKPDGERDEAFCFACETAEDLKAWRLAFKVASRIDMLHSMRLGGSMMQDLFAHRLIVKNRRMKVGGDGENHRYFEPVYKGSLWKVKAAGDRMVESHWYERDTWLARNGSLVYFSKKEERELIYYTAADVAQARLTRVAAAQSCRPWSFQIRIPPCSSDGLEFAPGEFAAPSEELRERWISEFERFGATSAGESH